MSRERYERSERYGEDASLLGTSDDPNFSLHGTNKGTNWYNKKTGFVKQSCTDIACCSMFGILLITMLGFITYAIIAGDYKKLYHGMNSEGQFCGIDLPDEEYVYFCKTHANMNELNFGDPICVTTCPDSSETLQPCSVGSQPSYPTHAVAGFYCYPDGQTLMKQMTGKMEDYFWFKIIADCYTAVLDTWPIMIVTTFTSLLIGYMYLFLLRSFAQTIITVATLVIVASFFLSGIYLFIASFFGGMDGVFNSGDGWGDRIFGLVLILIGFTTGGVACSARKDMKKTVQTMKVACECLFQCPALLSEPLLATFSRILVNIILILGFFMVLSTGTPVKEQVFHFFTYNFLQWIMIVFYVFMVFWINEIMYALSVWSVAFVVERWFFQPHDESGIKPSLPCAVLFNGYFTALVMHLGSLALGSVCIGLTRPIRIVWLFCIDVCRCGGECARQYWASVGVFNKDAYMDQALFSNDFIPSARHGAMGMHENKNVMMLAGTCWLVEFIGMAMLFLVGGLMMFFQMKLCGPFSSSDSNYYMPDPVTPSAVAAFMSLLIGTPFMLSFGQIADTMLYCFSAEPAMAEMEVAAGFAEAEGFFARLGHELYYVFTFQWVGNSKEDERKKAEHRTQKERSSSSAPDWFKSWVDDSGRS